MRRPDEPPSLLGWGRSAARRTARSIVVPLLALSTAVVLLGSSTSASAASVPLATSKLSGDITVSAAASLTEAFTKIAEAFERKHPNVTVTLNFGSSSTLVNQIQGGAPVDVFASADLANMDALVTAGAVKVSPTIFARNQMAIAVKPGNPERIRTLADLADVDTIALCGANVPCGVYAANILSRAGVTIPESRITRGQDAKATLAAVAHGDADAAIVYASDVNAAGKSVEGVPIPADENAVAVYPIAPIADRANPRLAKAFVAFVTSRAGRKMLARHGLLDPLT